MTTVYLVVRGEYSDYRVEAVCDTLDSAKEWIAIAERIKRDYYDIEERDLITSKMKLTAKQVITLGSGIYPDGVLIEYPGSLEDIEENTIFVRHNTIITSQTVRPFVEVSENPYGTTFVHSSGTRIKTLLKAHRDRVAKERARILGL